MTEWRPSEPWSPPTTYGGPPPGPLPSATPPPPPAPGRRRGVVVVVALAVVVVLALVGVGLWWALRGPSTPVAQPAGPSTATSPDFPSTSAAPTTSAPATTAATTPAAPATVSPGGMAIGAVATDPHVGAVVTVFDTYFRGINAHDAAGALSVFDPAGVIDPGDPAQVARFAHDIATTQDDQESVDAIAVTAAGLDVRVGFRSRQSPDLGPDGQACTQWSVLYHLTTASGRYLIHGSDASHTAC